MFISAFIFFIALYQPILALISSNILIKNEAEMAASFEVLCFSSIGKPNIVYYMALI